MAPIVSSIEIARAPADFDYVTDPSHLAEWRDSVIASRTEGDSHPVAGSRAVTTRRVGRGERTMIAEITKHDPPTSWDVRGIDGPVRGIVTGTVKPLDDGRRSRVTIELDFEGRGLGKLLVPLVVRRQAAKEMPSNLNNLKARLETDT